MKILIWGCGAWASYIVKNEIIPEDFIVGYIDSNKSQEIIWNKKVYAVDELLTMIEKIDFIVVAVAGYENNCEIYETIKEAQINLDRVFFLFNYYRKESDEIVNEQKEERLLEISKPLFDFYKKNIAEEKRKAIMYKCAFDLIDEKQLIIKTPLFNSTKYSNDYIRYRTFELMANEMEKNQIDGEIAELGVFQGSFSRLLNIKFKNRKLYLYDTFESFDKEEFMQEVKNGYCDKEFAAVFEGTNEDRVLKGMPYPELCVVRKGLFPESLKREDFEKKFAFVSLDVDFEKSTYEGLKFFYPRLTDGGAIFVHDFNNSFLGGVKKAISRYEAELGILLKKVPLCDEGGTVVIVK